MPDIGASDISRRCPGGQLKQSGDSPWEEETIEARTSQLIDVLLTVWAVPEGHDSQVVDAHDKSHDWVEVKDLVAAGFLSPGLVLTPRQGGWTSIDAVISDDGMLKVDGQTFGSPSGAGRYVKGSVTNGWTFWTLPDRRRLIDVRAAFRGEKPKEPGWTDALPRVNWSEEDLRDYAAGAAPLTLRLLDYVCRHSAAGRATHRHRLCSYRRHLRAGCRSHRRDGTQDLQRLRAIEPARRVRRLRRALALPDDSGDCRYLEGTAR